MDVFVISRLCRGSARVLSHYFVSDSGGNVRYFVIETVCFMLFEAFLCIKLAALVTTVTSGVDGMCLKILRCRKSLAASINVPSLLVLIWILVWWYSRTFLLTVNTASLISKVKTYSRHLGYGIEGCSQVCSGNGWCRWYGSFS